MGLEREDAAPPGLALPPPEADDEPAKADDEPAKAAAAAKEAEEEAAAKQAEEEAAAKQAEEEAAAKKAEEEAAAKKAEEEAAAKQAEEEAAAKKAEEEAAAKKAEEEAAAKKAEEEAAAKKAEEEAAAKQAEEEAAAKKAEEEAAAKKAEEEAAAKQAEEEAAAKKAEEEAAAAAAAKKAEEEAAAKKAEEEAAAKKAEEEAAAKQAEEEAAAKKAEEEAAAKQAEEEAAAAAAAKKAGEEAAAKQAEEEAAAKQAEEEAAAAAAAKKAEEEAAAKIAEEEAAAKKAEEEAAAKKAEEEAAAKQAEEEAAAKKAGEEAAAKQAEEEAAAKQAEEEAAAKQAEEEAAAKKAEEEAAAAATSLPGTAGPPQGRSAFVPPLRFDSSPAASPQSPSRIVSPEASRPASDSSPPRMNAGSGPSPKQRSVAASTIQSAVRQRLVRGSRVPRARTGTPDSDASGRHTPASVSASSQGTAALAAELLANEQAIVDAELEAREQQEAADQLARDRQAEIDAELVQQARDDADRDAVVAALMQEALEVAPADGATSLDDPTTSPTVRRRAPSVASSRGGVAGIVTDASGRSSPDAASVEEWRAQREREVALELAAAQERARLESEAAVKAQAAVRGRLARKQSARMLAEKRFDESAPDRAPALASIRAAAAADGATSLDDPTTSPTVRRRAPSVASSRGGVAGIVTDASGRSSPDAASVEEWRAQREREVALELAAARERARLESEAAVKAQAAVRGRLARKQSARMLAEKRFDESAPDRAPALASIRAAAAADGATSLDDPTTSPTVRRRAPSVASSRGGVAGIVTDASGRSSPDAASVEEWRAQREREVALELAAAQERARLESEAAVKAQAAVRGRLARKQSARMLAEKRFDESAPDRAPALASIRAAAAADGATSLDDPTTSPTVRRRAPSVASSRGGVAGIVTDASGRSSPDAASVEEWRRQHEEAKQRATAAVHLAAALAMQAAARGMLARKQTRRMAMAVQAVMARQAAARARQARAEAQAAVLLQAGARGMMARRDVERARVAAAEARRLAEAAAEEARAAEAEEVRVRMELAKAAAEEEAARRVQAGVRGRLARKQSARMLAEKRFDESAPSSPDAASVEEWRAQREREVALELAAAQERARLESEAAVKAQAAVRGRLARKQSARMLAEKRFDESAPDRAPALASIRAAAAADGATSLDDPTTSPTVRRRAPSVASSRGGVAGIVTDASGRSSPDAASVEEWRRQHEEAKQRAAAAVHLAAALAMQAAARGMLARKQTRRMAMAVQAVMARQAAARARQARAEAQAAVLLQAGARGMMARRDVERARVAAAEARRLAEAAAEEARAAEAEEVRVRMELAKAAAEEEAARRVQAGVRGRLARKQSARMRTEKRFEESAARMAPQLSALKAAMGPHLEDPMTSPTTPRRQRRATAANAAAALLDEEALDSHAPSSDRIAEWRAEAEQREEARRVAEAEAAARERAAVAVQSGVRGRLARKQSLRMLRDLREASAKEAAALALQARLRGYKGRLEVRRRVNSMRFEATASQRSGLARLGVDHGRSRDAESVPQSPVAREGRSAIAIAAAAGTNAGPSTPRAGDLVVPDGAAATLGRRPTDVEISRWRLQAERARIASQRVAEAMEREARARQEAEDMRNRLAAEDATARERARLELAKVAADAKAAATARQLAAAGRAAREESARLQKLRRQRQAEQDRRALEEAVMGTTPAGLELSRHPLVSAAAGAASPTLGEATETADVAAVAALHAAEAAGDEEGAQLAMAELEGSREARDAAHAATRIQALARGRLTRAQSARQMAEVERASVAAERAAPSGGAAQHGTGSGASSEAGSGARAGAADSVVSGLADGRVGGDASVAGDAEAPGSTADGVDLEGERELHEERMAALEAAEQHRREMHAAQTQAAVEAAKRAARAEAEAATAGAKAAKAAAEAAQEAAEAADARRRAAEAEFKTLRDAAAAEARQSAEETERARQEALQAKEERAAAEAESRALRARLEEAQAVAEGERLRAEARAAAEQEASQRAAESARLAEEALAKAEAEVARQREMHDARASATEAEVARHRALVLAAEEARAKALRDHEDHVLTVRANMEKREAEREAAAKAEAEAHRAAMDAAKRQAEEALQAAQAARQRDLSEAEARRMAEREALLRQSDEHRAAMEAAFEESQRRAEEAKEEMRQKRLQAEEKAEAIREAAAAEKARLEEQTRRTLAAIEAAKQEAIARAEAARAEAEQELLATRFEKERAEAELKEKLFGFEMAIAERERASEAEQAHRRAQAENGRLRRQLEDARAALSGLMPINQALLGDAERPALLGDRADPSAGNFLAPAPAGGGTRGTSRRSGRGAAFGAPPPPAASVYRLPEQTFAAPSPRARVPAESSEPGSPTPRRGALRNASRSRSRSRSRSQSREPADAAPARQSDARGGAARPQVRVSVPMSPQSSSEQRTPHFAVPEVVPTPTASLSEDAYKRAVADATRARLAELSQGGRLRPGMTEADYDRLASEAQDDLVSERSARHRRQPDEAGRPAPPQRRGERDWDSSDGADAKPSSPSPSIRRESSAESGAASPAPGGGKSPASIAAIGFAAVRARRASQRAVQRLNSPDLRRPSVFDNRVSPRSKSEEEARKAELRVATPWLVSAGVGSRLATDRPMTSHLSSRSESSPADMAEREDRRRKNIEAAERRQAAKRQGALERRDSSVKMAIREARAEGAAVAAATVEAKDAYGLYGSGMPAVPEGSVEGGRSDASSLPGTGRGTSSHRGYPDDADSRPPPPPPPPMARSFSAPRPGSASGGSGGRRSSTSPHRSSPLAGPVPATLRAPTDSPSPQLHGRPDAGGAASPLVLSPRAEAEVQRRVDSAVRRAASKAGALTAPKPPSQSLTVSGPAGASQQRQSRPGAKQLWNTVAASVAARRFASERRSSRQSLAGSFSRSRGGPGYTALAEAMHREEAPVSPRSRPSSSPRTSLGDRRLSRASSRGSGRQLLAEVLATPSESPTRRESDANVHALRAELERAREQLAMEKLRTEQAAAGSRGGRPSRATGGPAATSERRGSLGSILTSGPVHTYTESDAGRVPPRHQEAADDAPLQELEAIIAREAGGSGGDAAADSTVAGHDLSELERLLGL
ncbi:hypothetical protein FNF31_01599 [Cafeteria roenbergensis]|uniref:Uncharacterized protein n=1 Tax=Cafeteria roenbergensis TaxID=33653 RepID=A0A5A8DKK4_CAFRO|nr:hypothetical protein FNF31_01599 [Cafeteria roenbergensis]